MNIFLNFECNRLTCYLSSAVNVLVKSQKVERAMRALAAAVCYGLLSAVASPTSMAQSGTIEIAVAGSFTGSFATAGDQIRRGAEAAAASINGAGGIRGSKIVLRFEDDGCDPKQAVSVANRLVGAGVKLVNGHVCSGSSIPASEVYSEAGVLMMTPASVNSKLTDQAFQRHWPTIMRLYVRDDAQGQLVGQWMGRQFADKRVAFLHDKSAFGKNLADQVLAAARAAGVREVLYDGINAGEKDYGAVITRLKAEKVDVLYYGGYPTEAGLIVRQAADQGFSFKLIGTSAFATPEFWGIAGPAAAGTIFPFPADPKRWQDAEKAVSAIRASGFEPDGFTLFSYAVIEALAEGVRRAGRVDGLAISQALRAEPVTTIFGPTTFDAKGDAQGITYELNVWQDGRYRKLD
jgi:branched-chain amino acid transport system substrate-binding protein